MNDKSMQEAVVRLLHGWEGKSDNAVFEGTAFFITPELLLTAEHCVRTNKNQVLWIEQHEKYPIRVECLEKDAEIDIALLKVKTEYYQRPKYWLNPNPSDLTPYLSNEEVQSWGFYPDSHELAKPDERKLIEYLEEKQRYRLDHNVAKGFSGGPVTHENKLIGIMHGRQPDGSSHYIKPIHLVRHWVEKYLLGQQAAALEAWQRQFLENQWNQLRKIPTDSMLEQLLPEQIGKHTPLNTRALYTPLDVNRESEGNLNTEDKDSHRIQAENQRLFECLSEMDGPGLMLKGDPGCGKSTFMRYLCLRLCAQRLEKAEGAVDEEESLPINLTDTFPVFIEIKDLYSRIKDKSTINFEALQQALIDKLRQTLKANAAFEDWLQSDTQKVLWLFDGLDEINIDDEQRKHFMQEMTEWMSHRKNWITIFTMRPYAFNEGYDPDFTIRSVQPLNKESVLYFIKQFFQHIPNSQTDQSSEQQAQLLIGITQEQERDSLRQLISNPLLLTLTTALYAKGGKEALPTDRVGLYQKSLEALLLRWEAKQKADPNASAQKKEQKDYELIDFLSAEDAAGKKLQIHQALNHLAWLAHYDLNQASEKNAGDFHQSLIISAFKPYLHSDYGNKPETITSYLEQKTGVVIYRTDVYSFIHRSLREYLCARYLIDNAQLTQITQARLALYNSPNWWREVIALAARYSDEYSVVNSPTEVSQYNRSTEWLHSLLPRKTLSRDDHNTADWQVLEAISFAESERKALDQLDTARVALQEKLKTSIEELIESKDLEPRERNNAAISLSIIGDPRPGVGCKECEFDGKLIVIPDIQWVKAVAPKARIQLEGIDGDGFKIPHDFYLARYPVTNAQFQAFLDADDFAADRYWQGLPSEEKEVKPSQWPEPNHPKTDVTWYQAVAYSRWLTAVCDRLVEVGQPDLRPIPGGEIRLPDEWEWQWAAAGVEEREFPWGQDHEEGLANLDETWGERGLYNIQRTSAVGIYPKGHTPSHDDSDNWADLAGNVWEWCRNSYSNPCKLWNATLDKKEVRVLRGGSWILTTDFARCAFRDNLHPYGCYFGIGFRLLCSPIREP